MKKTCDSCGIEKDPAVHEPYLGFPGKLFHPLLEVHVQGPSEFRVATICIACSDKLVMDMWTAEEYWAELSPKVPYAQLPLLP